jgi:hypothetical protein
MNNNEFDKILKIFEQSTEPHYSLACLVLLGKDFGDDRLQMKLKMLDTKSCGRSFTFYLNIDTDTEADLINFIRNEIKQNES